MPNRFGFKDFVVLALLVVTVVMLGLVMKQTDRQWERLLQLQSKMTDLEKQLRSLEGQPRVSGSGSTGSIAPGPGARDESWIVPGVPVQWQPAWTYITDPSAGPGYSEGGSFVEIINARPAKLTPFIQTDVYGRRAVDLVVESLGAYDSKTMVMRGVLAEAWQVDPQGLWLRAKIRDSARFADGTPVTSEDQRWTFHEYIMNTQLETQRTRSIISDKIDKVLAISDKVVEFRFKQRMFDNIEAALGLGILPQSAYAHLTPAEINKGTGLLFGSGPYKMLKSDPDDQWRPSDDVVLVRNERYWGPRSPLETIRLRVINDEQAGLIAYDKGDAEMFTPSSPQYVTKSVDEAFLTRSRAMNWTNLRSGNAFIAWNCGQRPGGRATKFTDARVRRAMTMLVDREKMIRDIFKGIGTVSAGSFLPDSPARDPELRPLAFDPPAAAALLKEAGWEDRNRDGVLEDPSGEPFVFEMTYFTGGEIAERIALFLKDAFQAGGIRMIPKGIDWAVGDPVRKQRDFDALIQGWSGGGSPESDPKQIFHSASIKDQGDNFAQWSSPKADELIDAGRLEMDTNKRYEIWRRFQRVMHEEQPYTWLRIAPNLRFVKRDIGNVIPYKNGLNFWEFYRASGPITPGPVN